MLFRIEKGLFSQSDAIPFPKHTLIGFLIALVFGGVLGVLVESRVELFLDNVPLILFSLALLFPTYKVEYFLGFVLGLTYFIGGILPIVVGSVFLLISIGVDVFTDYPLILKLVKLTK